MKAEPTYKAILIVVAVAFNLLIAQAQSKKKSDTLPTYSFYSATAYFSGNGQPYVTTQTFINSDLVAMCRAIDSASKGAVVTIDNLRYFDKDGKIRPVKEVPYQFNKQLTPSPIKSQAAQEVEKLKALNFISGTIYFSGAGFQNVTTVNSRDTSLLFKYCGWSMPGTIITLDNCIYKNQDGSLSKSLTKAIKLE